jgi:hypothetical protein
MPPANGQFSGNPKTEWLAHSGADRNMKLLEDFWYIDPAGRRWDAPAGSEVNGASIPPPLWSVVGSPYTGEYRRASVVHDVACDDPTVDRRDADRMFYYACLAGGCTKTQARLLYTGVRIGAWVPSIPVWEGVAVDRVVMRAEPVSTMGETSIRSTYYEIAAELDNGKRRVSFEELEQIVDAHLEAKADTLDTTARRAAPR